MQKEQASLSHSNDEIVLLDVTRMIWRIWSRRLPTGIDRTVLAYAEHFGSRARAVVQRDGFGKVLSQVASKRLFELFEQTGEWVRLSVVQIALSDVFRQSILDLTNRLYINVGHTGLEKQGHSDWLERTGVKPIYFLHDLIPLTHPEYCRSGEPQKHVQRVATLMDRGAGIIANSADTVNNLQDFARRHYAKAVPATIIAPLGAELSANVFRIIDDSASPPPSDPYFLMLGTIEGRKNHLLMLNIWAEMARSLGDACPKLVIIGKRGWECEQAVDLLERCEIIRGKVIELPRCDDAQLDRYMRGARALVFPSFVEGYGLPLVEALFCGTPVIASNLGVFRELAGDVPDYFSPIDGVGWKNAILSYAAPNSPARDAQIARMQGWVAPTWSAHFNKVDEWLTQFRN